MVSEGIAVEERGTADDQPGHDVQARHRQPLETGNQHGLRRVIGNVDLRHVGVAPPFTAWRLPLTLAASYFRPRTNFSRCVACATSKARSLVVRIKRAPTLM